jgi:hypothetical protein
MSKPTKKRQTYNTEVVKALSQEFEVSTQFVRQCIRKEKHSLTAQNIEKKYREIAGASAKAIEKFKSNPTH